MEKLAHVGCMISFGAQIYTINTSWYKIIYKVCNILKFDKLELFTTI